MKHKWNLFYKIIFDNKGFLITFTLGKKTKVILNFLHCAEFALLKMIKIFQVKEAFKFVGSSCKYLPDIDVQNMFYVHAADY